MLRDSSPTDQHYDAVIIGSGPAGMTLAFALAEAGRRVAMIESGDLQAQEAIQDLSRVEASGDLDPNYYPVHAQRLLGGTSALWAGWCVPLEPRAFDAGAWPFPRSELAAWYPAACAALRVSTDTLAEPRPLPPGRLVYKPFYLSPAIRFGSEYVDLLRAHEGIDVFLQSTVLRLIHTGERCTAAAITDSTGGGNDAWELHGDRFFCAAGGIGNPRLLALSGLGGDSNGRFFMEHPHLYHAGDIDVDPAKLNELHPGPEAVVHGFQLSNECCHELGLLNFSVSLRTRLDEPDPAGMPLAGRRVGSLTSVANIRAEMPPRSENRLTLSRAVDGLGQRRGHMDFHFGVEDFSKPWELMVRGLIAAGVARIGPLLRTPEKLTGGGHYIGTTRMGTDPQRSVADPHCRVHGLTNTYLLGSSLFPACGVANPTLTIVALALRLADHVLRQAKEP